MDRHYEKQEKKAQREVALYYLAFLKLIRNELAKLDEKDMLTFSAMQKYNRMKHLEKMIRVEGGKLTSSATSTIKKNLRTIYEDRYYRVAYSIESTVGAKLGYRQLTADKVNSFLVNPSDAIGWVERNRFNNTVMVRQVIDQIGQGLNQGKPFREISKAVKERLDVGAGKAMTITRTEGGRLYSLASLESAKQAESVGVILTKQWVSTLDSRTRDTHQELDGQKVDLDGMFEVNGLQAEAPRLFGVAEEDLRCRCTMITLVEGYSPEFRRARGEDIIPYKNYSEWKQARIEGQ